MSEVDPAVGIIAYLKADAAIAGLVASRVFGDEIPPSRAGGMPLKCIVVEPSGGTQTFGNAYQDYGDGRFDIFSYGETPFEAGRVQRTVYGAMKRLRRAVHGGVLLHWAKRDGGPLPLRDPDANWPYRFESYQVLTAEVTIT